MAWWILKSTEIWRLTFYHLSSLHPLNGNDLCISVRVPRIPPNLESVFTAILDIHLVDVDSIIHAKFCWMGYYRNLRILQESPTPFLKPTAENKKPDLPIGPSFAPRMGIGSNFWCDLETWKKLTPFESA